MLYRQFLSTTHFNKLQVRSISITRVLREFVGRDFVNPEQQFLKDWQTILWTAMDLKCLTAQRCKYSFDFLTAKHITHIVTTPSCKSQVAFSLAAQILGARETVIYDPGFERQPSCADSGRMMSRLTDAIVAHGVSSPASQDLADGSTVPVISSCSTCHNLVLGLSSLLTLQETFCHLKGLTLAYIGPPRSLLNTFLWLCPVFGIKLQFYTVCPHGRGGKTPAKLHSALKACQAAPAGINECQNMEEAVYRADVIVTSLQYCPNNQITHKTMQEASLDWKFLHTLPRSTNEVDDDVFGSKNNLTWYNSENHLYIAMALLLRCLRSYAPSICMPNFDGPT